MPIFRDQEKYIYRVIHRSRENLMLCNTKFQKLKLLDPMFNVLQIKNQSIYSQNNVIRSPAAKMRTNECFYGNYQK
jgi:hypothetical protein